MNFLGWIAVVVLAFLVIVPLFASSTGALLSMALPFVAVGILIKVVVARLAGGGGGGS